LKLLKIKKSIDYFCYDMYVSLSPSKFFRILTSKYCTHIYNPSAYVILSSLFSCFVHSFDSTAPADYSVYSSYMACAMRCV